MPPSARAIDEAVTSVMRSPKNAAMMTATITG